MIRMTRTAKYLGQCTMATPISSQSLLQIVPSSPAAISTHFDQEVCNNAYKSLSYLHILVGFPGVQLPSEVM